MIIFSMETNMKENGLISTELELSSQGGSDGRGIKHEWGRGGMHIGFWWESRKEIDH
jgi:hypothetical protein